MKLQAPILAMQLADALLQGLKGCKEGLRIGRLPEDACQL